MKHNIFREGKVHVLSEMCATCVFRPGNLMQLQPGRLKGMIEDAKKDESTIVCHSTLHRKGVKNAACRGFFDKHKTSTLQIAERLEMVEYDPPPPKLDSGSVVDPNQAQLGGLA
jgi:hypothetical protein